MYQIAPTVTIATRANTRIHVLTGRPSSAHVFPSRTASAHRRPVRKIPAPIRILYHTLDPANLDSSEEVHHGVTTWRRRPRFRSRDHRRPHSLSRLGGRFVGGDVLAPQGLHARLHHRARVH